MKKVISVLLLVAIVFSLCACSGAKARDRYIGTWEDESGYAVLVLNSNSKFVFRLGEKIYTGNWEVKEEKPTGEEVGMATNMIETLLLSFNEKIFNIPVETVPAETVPAETVPQETTVPEETVPQETTVPEETAPAETVAETTGETAPAETEPAETVPAETEAPKKEVKDTISLSYRIIEGKVYLVTEELISQDYYLKYYQLAKAK